MTIRVFIDGAAGTTGIDIAERLARRDDLSLILLDDADRKNATARGDALAAADFAILCLPDDAAREAVALADARASTVRLIDASSAHRTAAGWTYGFAELRPGQRDAIRHATRVSNPGCYPTGFLALVAPLVARGLIPADYPYSVNAVSGYSGGGKALIDRFEAAGDIAYRAYALWPGHKHVPEMQHHAGLTHPPLFAPAVVNAFRGMVVDVPLPIGQFTGAPTADSLRAALADHYADAALVRVADTPSDGEILLRAHQAPSDVLELFVTGDQQQARLIARLDNLGKGASGACVQALNIMAELPETAGLRL